jgi:hypothetical protein
MSRFQTTSLETKQGKVFIEERTVSRKNGDVQTLTQLIHSWHDLLKVASMGITESYQSLMDKYSKGLIEKASLRTDKHAKAESWCMGVDFDGAIKLAKLGWTEHLKEVRMKKQLLVNRVGKRVKKQELVYAPTGTEFDVVKVMQGIPDPWASTAESEKIVKGTGNKLRKLVVNVSMSCATSSKTIMTKGILITSLIDLLESNGYSVALDLASACGGVKNKKHQLICPIKSFNQATNLPLILYCLGHPTVLRRLIFGCQENALNLDWLDWTGVGFNYGHVASLDREFHGDLYIDNNTIKSSDMITTEGQVNWLMEQMKRQGLEVKGGF